MERLTFDGNFCDIAQCRELPCPHGGSCTQRKVWEKLKAYEDLGLDPEEYERALSADIMVRVAAVALGVPAEALRDAEYIKREAVLALVRPDAPEDEKAAVTIATAKKLVRSIVRRTPAADVAPVVHGHFVHDGPRFAGGVDWWNCSNCGRLASGVETRFDYCPWRGARMDGDDDAKAD